MVIGARFITKLLMAGQRSSASPTASLIGYPVTEKLTRNNHALWKVQVLSALRGAQVARLIDPATPLPDKTVPQEVDKKIVQVPSPEYAIWVVKNQQVLNFLLHRCRGRFSLTSPPCRRHQALGLLLMQCLHHSRELT
jgi:hypothetical protein